MTRLARGLIDERTENCESREETQDCSDRADRIAVCPAVSRRENKDDDESDRRNDESRQTLDPYLLMGERIPAALLRNPCAEIVSPYPYRREKVLCDTSERTVRSQKNCQCVDSQDHGDYENSQDTIAEPFLLRRPGIVFLVLLAPALEEAGDDILEDAQRTNH